MKQRTKKTLFIYSLLVFAFFYIPIMVLIIFSFNDSRLGTVWTGFTFDWYSALFNNTKILAAFANSMIVAVVSTFLSIIIGTLAALAFHRYYFIGKDVINTLFLIPVIIPDIVIGVSLLVIYGLLNIKLSLLTIIPGHVVWGISFVSLIVLSRMAGLDRNLVEAAKDLGANAWQTFWRITFPLIFPGILAGALITFSLSLDEFEVAFFTTGPNSETLPVLIYSMVRKGVSPEVNALSTLLVLIVVIAVLIWAMYTYIYKRKEDKN